MPDIFDQVAAPPAASGGGDIFDQVAAPAPEPAPAPIRPLKGLTDLPSAPDADRIFKDSLPASFQPKLSPTYNPADHAQGNAGAKGIAIVPKTPQDTPQTLDDRVRQQYAPKTAIPTAGQTPNLPTSAPDNMRERSIFEVATGMTPAEMQAVEEGRQQEAEMNVLPLKTLGQAGVQAVTGAGKIFLPSPSETRASPSSYQNQLTGKIGAPETKEESAQSLNRVVGGVGDVVSGAGTLALAADAPAVLETGAAALTGNIKAAVQMGKMAAGIGIGSVASNQAGKLADHYNLTPEAKATIQAMVFFTPSLAGMAGIRVEGVDGPKGKGVVAFGKTDPATGKPGFSAGVRFNAPTDPVAVTAQDMLQQNTQAMQDSAKADAAAALIVKGASPQEAVAAQQAKAPPTPADQAAAQMFPTPVIQQQHMTAAAEIIKALPPEHQGAATLQAHDQLAAQIAKWTTFVGPDGKTYTNNSPKDPAKYASQFINAEVDKHDAGIAAAQKQQETAATEPATPATATAKGTSKLQQAAADKQYARAKTVIESSDSPQAAIEAMQAGGVSPEQAQQFIARHQAEQVPTVGSKDEPVVEESRATVDAQLAALKAGTIKAVMLPAGSAYRPAAPAGMKVMDVTGDTPGAGRYIYDPTKLRPSTIREAAKAGTHGVLMGHVDDKESLAAAPETVAVVAHKPDGTEIQSSEVTPEHAEAQAAILHERHPDAQISVKPIDDVIGDRLGAQKEESTPVNQDAIDKAMRVIRAQKRAELERKLGNVDRMVAAEQELRAAEAAQAPIETAFERAKREKENAKPESGASDEQLASHGDNFDQAAESASAAEQVATPSQTEGGKVANTSEQTGADHNGLAAAPAKSVEGHDGKKTSVLVDGNKVAATYRLIESHHIQPSHDPISFEKNPKHPGNQRDYEKPDAKARVMDHAQNMETDYLVNNNPDAVNGPPIIEPDAAVDGGNSRAMSIQRAYKMHPDSAKKYVAALREHAASFGFTPEQIDGMKEPMLVREIDSIADPKEREDMVAALNRSKTADLTPGEAAVSNGRKLTPETMDELSRLIDATGDGASIRDMLREHGREAIKLFEKSGVVTEDQRPKYIANGEPSEAGKDLIEDAILGNVVDDSKLMDTAPKGILRKLDGALAAVAHIGSQADSYNLIPVIRDALEQHAEISKRGTTVQDFQNQPGLMAQRTENPVVDAIARKLAEKPTEVKRTLKAFALDAKDGRLGQGSLMGPPPTAADAFNHAFGTTLSEKEYTHGLARGISEEEPRTADSGVASRDSGVHEGGPERPETKGPGSVDRGGSRPAEPSKTGEVEPYSPKKDERVRYKLKDGTEKTGRFKAAFGPSAVRMAPDGGGKPDVISKANILGPAEEAAAATPATHLTSDALANPVDGYDENQFHNRLRATDAEFAANAHFIVVPASGSESPSVHVNPDAYQLLRKMPVFAHSGRWSGVSLDAESAFQLRQQLKAFANRNEGAAKSNALALRGALAGDKYGNVIIVHQGAPAGVEREEQFHNFQRREGMAFGTRDLFEDLPGYLKAEEALKAGGYSLASPEHLATEVVAHIAAGFGDSLGLAREEQAGILKKFFDVTVAQNGPEVLERIPQLAEEWMYPTNTEVGDGDQGALEKRSKASSRSGEEPLKSLPATGDDKAGGGVQERSEPEPETAIDRASPERGSAADRSIGPLFSNSGGLKPLSKLKATADAGRAMIGDEADRVAVSRDLHNGLYDLASQDNAAVLRAVQMLKQMPGTAKDQEVIYHHLEDPKLPLTELQQDILDDYLTPLVHQAEHDFQVVSEGGVPLENYVHRQVIDRNSMIDRLIDKAQSKTPGGSGVGGSRLSKTAPAAKHRTMMAIEDVKTGERSVVSIKGGRVTLLEKGTQPKDIGALAPRMTKVGREAEAKAAPYVKEVTELRHEIEFAKSADHAEQLADVQRKIAELEKQFEILDQVKARVGMTSPGTPDLLGKNGPRPVYSKEATFNERAEITRKLEPLRKAEEAIKAGTQPMLAKNVMKLSRRKEALKDAEAARDHFLNELPAESFEDGAWKGPDGKLYKITQATTKEIEANTDVRYYHNAAASVVVNYLAMDKARRAYEFLEDFKNSPEFAAGSHAIDTPGAIPKGWKATQLAQLRGYFFEPHIAEVLDTYAKAASSDPNVLEKVGNFLRNSIFFNPLIHVPNLLNHWVVERGVSSVLNPLAYPRATRAGIRAINAVIHQNADFLAALDAGAPLQSQQFETKQFADLFFKKMQDELGDPESSKVKELAAALGMAPVRLVKAIYDFSGKVTWYTNDIAFMQATYEKMEKGMSLKDALRETAKHIPDYRKMTRIFDSKALGTVMSNPTITMFGAYHYGALKSYGQMAKSLTGFNWQDAGTKNAKGEPTNAAGRTSAQEKLHGLDTLAMVGIVTFLLYPLLDKLWKDFTGNDKAQMRRAGASTLIYNLAMLAKGEKTPTEVVESIATPAIPLKTAVELAINRDTRTGQRIYDPHAKGGVISEQVGRRVLGSVAPVDQGLQVAEGKTDWKKLMYSMVGVSFPLHGAEKIASQINAERIASLPPSDEETVIHYVTRSRALHDYWDGDGSKMAELLASDDYTRKEKMKLRKDLLLPPLVYEIKGMSYSDALRVYNAGTEEQKQEMRIPMARKLYALRKAGKPVPDGDDE